MSVYPIIERPTLSQPRPIATRQTAGPADTFPTGYIHEDAVGLLTLQLLEGRSEDVIRTTDRLMGTLREHGHSAEVNDLRILRGLAELDVLSAAHGGRTPSAETALRFALRILPTLKRLVAADSASLSRTGISDDSRTAPVPVAHLEQPLSRREKEILGLTERGLSNKEIAGQLWIAEGTVKKHQSNLFTKLNVRNRTEAVVKARQIGIF